MRYELPERDCGHGGRHRMHKMIRHEMARHGRHGGFGRHGRRGPGGPGGDGSDEMMHAGRLMAQGDLRLIVLALIAEQPRHGYDLIKVIEEKTADWYSPSPGIVYPTLTFLEEAGYVTSQPDGAKKLYTVTIEGNAYLAENRALVDAGLQRLTMIGEKARRIRERMRNEEGDDDRPRVPHMVRAALHNLRDAAAERLGNDPDAEAKITEILVRAAGELRKRDN
ncbi:MAG: PadR family transcriptional regulator [Pseudolabrys sp.]